MNDGKAHFTIAGTSGDPNWPTRNVTLADLDGDGRADIAVANRGGPNYVCLNDGHARFPKCERLGPESAATIAAGDTDGDGSEDLVVAHRDNGQSVVYFNEGHGTFGKGLLVSGPDAEPYSMIAADMNGDGRPEIIVGFVEAPGLLFVNDGTGRHYTRVPFGDNKGAIYGFAVGDLNGDGVPDLVAARSDAPSLIFFNRLLKGQR